MPVIQVLGGLGIGCVYISRRKDESRKNKTLVWYSCCVRRYEVATEGTAKKYCKTVKALSAVLSERTLPLVWWLGLITPSSLDEFTRVVKRSFRYRGRVSFIECRKPKRSMD